MMLSRGCLLAPCCGIIPDEVRLPPHKDTLHLSSSMYMYDAHTFARPRRILNAKIAETVLPRVTLLCSVCKGPYSQGQGLVEWE